MRLVPWLLVVGLVGVVGCGTKQSKGTVGPVAKAAEDPWPAAVVGLRKETTAGGLARVLGELTAASVDGKYAPEPLPASAEVTLKEIGRLTDDDLRAIRPAGYSALDPHYLAECFYLRDVARGLEADGLPPEAKARRAFDWVCRQVLLAPWIGPGRSAGEAMYLPPMPASSVLRKGAGSGLERAFVLLALCQQLGLDAVLVGPPDAADKAWRDDPAPKPPGAPRGPFWAVGVRAGGDVLLFDPWRGVPFTGPGSNSVLTLTQAVANPDAAKEAIQPADKVKASVPFFSLPTPALAPRLKRLEAELKADAGRLFVDLPALVKGFADTTKTTPQVWNPPADPFAYPRVLAAVIPRSEGGAAADPSLFQSYRFSLLPVAAMRLPAAVEGMVSESAALDLAVVRRVRERALSRYSRHFLNAPTDRRSTAGMRMPFDQGVAAKMMEDPTFQERLDKLQQGAEPAEVVLPLEAMPTARERVQRGLLPDPVRGLVELRVELTAADTRIRSDRTLDQRLIGWAADAKEVFGAVLRARDRGTAIGPAPLVEYERKHKATLDALVDLMAVPPELAEATVLIALAKHEQAVREQGRADRTPADIDRRRRAADAWAEARNWWGLYEPFADANDKSFPGRAAQARRLAAEAASRAGG